jgi:hypothetical protein
MTLVENAVVVSRGGLEEGASSQELDQLAQAFAGE